MNFSRALNESLRFWPESIDISDGTITNDGGNFPQLSAVWCEAEEMGTRWSEWHQLSIWAIFCGLHRMARVNFKEGNFTLEKRALDRAYLETKFAESLLNNAARFPRNMRRSYLRKNRVRDLLNN
jgi:hypothetical protein